MPKEKSLDFLFLGPVYPLRGGIADTQEALGEKLTQQGYNVQMWSFSHLYPSFLFPGKSQYSVDKKTIGLTVHQKIHAYNPLHWNKIAKEINSLKPKAVIFRYWTPFLAPVWVGIARKLSPTITRIGLVDNWVAHEPKPWDNLLTRYFEKKMHAFTTLSRSIKHQIEQTSEKEIWAGFHPIDSNLPHKIAQPQARKLLKITPKTRLVLFFGLIRPYKGLDLLLNAMALHPTLHLLIVGESYESEKKYRAIIDRKGLHKRVKWENRYVSIQEAAHFFSASDGVVLPYRKASQSGVISLAYQYETPLLVTDHDGIADPIRADQTGVVCAPNEKAIAEGIGKLVDSDANTIFRKNLNQSKKNYSWEKYANDFSSFCLHEINQY